MKRQALLCHRVLRTIEGVAKESAILTRDTWETLLKFLLAANDSLLSPPTEKGLPLFLFFFMYCSFAHNLDLNFTLLFIKTISAKYGLLGWT